MKFKGTSLKISRAKKPKAKANVSEYVNGATKIFVGAIPANVTLEEFKHYFLQYGPIRDLSLPLKNKFKNINKGHGFVTYEHPYSAKLAVEDYAKHCMRAKWVI